MSVPLVWAVLGSVAAAIAVQYLLDPLAFMQAFTVPVWAMATSTALRNMLLRWLSPLLQSS